jgi:cysteine synthase B
MTYETIEDTIGNTPLVQLVRLVDDDIRSRNSHQRTRRRFSPPP